MRNSETIKGRRLLYRCCNVLVVKTLNLRFTKKRFSKKRNVKIQDVVPLIIVVKTGLCTPSRSS